MSGSQAPSQTHSPIHSMTGFAAVEGDALGARIRIEIKTLNHRFIDVKLRLARELAAIELPLRQLLQSRFSRGAFEVKVERLVAAGPTGGATTEIQLNEALAKSYFDALTQLRNQLGLTTPITVHEIAQYPDVISRQGAEFDGKTAWTSIEPILLDAASKLEKMRAHEGAALVRALQTSLDELAARIADIRSRRTEYEAAWKEKTRTRIREVFDAYPIADNSVAAVLDSRIAQELAIHLDRTDVEEELTRFQGHIEHFRKVLKEGGHVGRKLDFLLQELNREVNTLGNKAQDLGISEQTIQMKVRVEQLREQVMNLE